MKIVIDIPDVMYTNPDRFACDVLARAIEEGVVIKDEEFFSMLLKSVMTKEQFDEIMQELAKSQKGKWISNKEYIDIFLNGRIPNFCFKSPYNCNKCGYSSDDGTPHFCPNCGADMRGEDNGECNAN